MKRTKVVAEIGQNHQGRMEIAKEMILTAKACKADAVKFQKRTISVLAAERPNIYQNPHPNPWNAFGPTYEKHREALEFSIAQHRELKEYCETYGIEYSCSVWDLQAAIEIALLNPAWIKIPSASNLCLDMYDWLADNFAGNFHISLGMTTEKEEYDIVDYLKKKGLWSRVVLYHCTSGYPVDFKDVCLKNIEHLVGYGVPVGYSGHHLGIAIDIAAVTLGASWIERHFTLDRTWKGTDHAASLEPVRRVFRGM